jgi:hypothetical protein
MQRVSREIALESPNDMDDQASDPTVALIAPPKTCETTTQLNQGNIIASGLTLTPDVENPDSAGRKKEAVTNEGKRKFDNTYC